MRRNYIIAVLLLTFTVGCATTTKLAKPINVGVDLSEFLTQGELRYRGTDCTVVLGFADRSRTEPVKLDWRQCERGVQWLAGKRSVSRSVQPVEAPKP